MIQIHLLVARETAAGADDAYWVEDAVDEYTIDEWSGAYPTPFQEKLDKDPANRRVLIVNLPFDALDRPFRVPEVKGEVE